MKKAASILIVLLTNIAILAHSVVPHHHHNRFFAAVVNLLDEDTQKALNHTHEGATVPAQSEVPIKCAIDETLAFTNRQVEEGRKCGFQSVRFGCGPQFFVADLPDAILCVPNCSYSSLSIPYLTGCHSGYVACSIDLRAPPFC